MPATLPIAEHAIRDILVKKGMDYYDVGDLGFNLANVTADIDSAMRDVVRAHERRERFIRAAAENGMTYRQIAKYVGLSHQRVAQIVTSGGR